MNEFNFSCGKCPRTFKLQEFYEKHKKVHELKKQHTCDVCGFVYGAAKGLEGHFKTHTDEEVAVAAVRKQGGGQRQPPTRTQISAPEPPPFMNFPFLSRNGVLAEAKAPQPQLLPPPQQQQQPARRTSEKALSFDLEMAEAKATAPGGTGSYEIYDSIPHSMSNCPQNERGFFGCGICAREFSGLNSLKKHVPIHTRRVQHRCDMCAFVFGKREYLIDHVRSHTGEISPVCAVCKQTFNKSLKLKDHMKVHKNLNADGSVHEILPYRCHVCREVFQLAAVLGNHLATSHPTEATPSYRCDKCPATFGDVRGKNHHMYNEHQTDNFHQKCVWCPVCNQGFTRHYNLKVHMYKAHGKDYVENNFSAAEFAALTKPPPGGSTNGTARANKVANNNAKPQQHYFDEKKGTQVFSCQFCNQTFVRRTDLSIHLESVHHLPMHLVTAQPDDSEPPPITINPVKRRSSDLESDSKKRRPGPASRTNAPSENRSENGSSSPVGVQSSNIPSYLMDSAQVDGGRDGYKCQECGKVLQHKQSFLSHMKVIHGNFYGGNKWKGSSVVDMILEESSKISPRKRPNRSGPDANATICSVCEAVFPNPSSLRNHVVNVHINGSNFACDLCGKAFLCQENLDAHTKSKHPNLAKRLQSLRDALGLSSGDMDDMDDHDGSPDAKKLKLDGTMPPDINANTLPSDAVLPQQTILSFSLSNSTPSLSLSSTVSPVIVEYPLNLSKNNASVSVSTSSPSSSCPSSPKPTSASIVLPLPLPPIVALPSTPVPPKDLAELELPSTPLPFCDIIVSGAAVNNNNEGEGPIVIPGDDSVVGSGGRKKNSICKVCGVVLSPKTNVNVHMRTHSGARPYQCVLCLNRFRQKAHLMKHFRCSHNQKRPPFVCLFCPDELATSNDLYRHITDKHKAETDELIRVNGIQPPAEADEVEAVEQQQLLAMQEEQNEEETKQEEMEDSAEEEPEVPMQMAPEPQQQPEPEAAAPEPVAQPQQQQPQEEEDNDETEEEDVRYEPITEPFLFEGQVVYPCYCILPYVSDADVEATCKRSISAYYVNADDEEADEDGQLTIDESRVDEEEEEEIPEPKGNNTAQLAAILEKAEKANSAYNAEDIKNDESGFYPNMSDYALPFSLSSMWKKKADILPPETLHQLEMMQKMEEIKQLNAPVKEKVRTASKPKPASKKKRDAEKAAAKAAAAEVAEEEEEAEELKAVSHTRSAKEKLASPVGGGVVGENNAAATSTEISEHESQVQNDNWPVNCIKCNLLIDTLENFNLHMNDHWSDDKCCPVCGLLINSKRFNFKQHLKIHTGEKPFVCKICSRSFRQKAHMVKHITTHRTMPGGGEAAAVAAN